MYMIPVKWFIIVFYLKSLYKLQLIIATCCIASQEQSGLNQADVFILFAFVIKLFALSLVYFHETFQSWLTKMQGFSQQHYWKCCCNFPSLSCSALLQGTGMPGADSPGADGRVGKDWALQVHDSYHNTLLGCSYFVAKHSFCLKWWNSV